MIYKEFIQAIELALPDLNQKKICDELAIFLESNAKTVYNKMVCRSRFSAEEMLKIAGKYGIALDSIIHPKAKLNKPYPFYIRGEYFKPRTFEEYILNLHHFFQPLVKHKQYIETTYLSRELSIFHLFHFPRLLYFKLFMWNKLNWNSVKTTRYAVEEWITQPQVQIAIETFLLFYSDLDETEIWSFHLFDTFLNQIENAVTFGIITNGHDKRMIFQELEECVEYLENLLETGRKIDFKNKPAANISVYLNNLIVSPDMINIKIKEKRINYIMVDTPNFLESKDQDFCLSMEKFVKNIQAHSFSISNANKLRREDMIMKLRKSIQDTKAKILPR